MAAVHLLLPQAYGWRQYLDLIPQKAASAILAVNFVFSFLILWGGCLTIIAAIRRKRGRAGNSLVLYALAVFWTIYVLYQTRVPPPIPEYPRKLLLVVAGLIALLYLIFLVTRPLADARERGSGNSSRLTSRN
jgi:succinate-acetate transporter protein